MNRYRPLALTLLLLAPAARLPAAPPAWWSEAGTTILAPGQPAQNYAPANLGQLKQVATQAKKHLDAQSMAIGGAGPAINALVANFTPAGGHTAATRAANCAPINLGQLKAVAKPFYDRLLAVGYNTKQNLIDHGAPGWTQNYAWNPAAPIAQNYSPANLGQLKWVFSFDLAKDTDGDAIPDWWALKYFGSVGLVGNADADGDGVTNYQEYVNGTDPKDYYNGARRNGIPVAPTNVRITLQPDGSKLVEWDDASDNEQRFIIYDDLPGGGQVEVGRVGPGQTSFLIPAPSQP